MGELDVGFGKEMVKCDWKKIKKKEFSEKGEEEEVREEDKEWCKVEEDEKDGMMVGVEKGDNVK